MKKKELKDKINKPYKKLSENFQTSLEAKHTTISIVQILYQKRMKIVSFIMNIKKI